MKPYPAIAIIEYQDIPAGVYATDALVKKSPIAMLKCGIISRGRYLSMFGGSTAAVDESYQEGLFWGKDSVLDSVFLPDIHPQLHDAVLGRRQPDRTGALAIIETETVSCNVRAAELALKGVPVELAEIRIAESGLDGKGISFFRGELYDIEAAVDGAVSFLRQLNRTVRARIIPAPHEALTGHMGASAFFTASGLTELEGEAS